MGDPYNWPPQTDDTIEFEKDDKLADTIRTSIIKRPQGEYDPEAARELLGT